MRPRTFAQKLRLEHETIRRLSGGFRLDTIAIRGGSVGHVLHHCVADAGVVVGKSPFPDQRHAADRIGAATEAPDRAGICQLQTRRTKTATYRTTQQQAVNHFPRSGQFRPGYFTRVAVFLITACELHIEGLDQRNALPWRHQRHCEFGKSRFHVAAATNIRRSAVGEKIAFPHLAGVPIDILNRPVDVFIAIVKGAFVAVFHTLRRGRCCPHTS